jgi:hypothetical protein
VARSAAGYSSVVARLADLQAGTLIGPLGERPDQYPFAIFRFPSDDQEAINISVQAVVSTNFLRQDFAFFDFRAGAPRSVELFLANDFSIPLRESFSLASVTRLIREHSHGLLGPWSLETIRFLPGLFAAVFVPTNASLAAYASLARVTYGNFTWGASVASPPQLLARFNLTTFLLPAVVVIDVRGDRFFKLPRARAVADVILWLSRVAVNSTQLQALPLNLQGKRPPPKVPPGKAGAGGAAAASALWPGKAMPPARGAPDAKALPLKSPEPEKAPPLKTPEPEKAPPPPPPPSRWSLSRTGKQALAVFGGTIAVTGPIFSLIAYCIVKAVDGRAKGPPRQKTD